MNKDVKLFRNPLMVILLITISLIFIPTETIAKPAQSATSAGTTKSTKPSSTSKPTKPEKLTNVDLNIIINDNRLDQVLEEIDRTYMRKRTEWDDKYNGRFYLQDAESGNWYMSYAPEQKLHLLEERPPAPVENYVFGGL